jgi:phosphohistidine phosphatase SixA
MFKTLLISLMIFASAPAGATEAGWALLRDGGQVVLLRHAYSSGSGNANLVAEDCSTQRNLSERGRQQARKMGALFAARAAPTDKVLSSRYCRCLETARTVFGDRIVEEFAPLDPPSTDPAAKEADATAIMEAIRGFTGSGNLVLVTHLETIMLLTGAAAREGEALIVTPQGEGLHVLAHIVFN